MVKNYSKYLPNFKSKSSDNTMKWVIWGVVFIVFMSFIKKIGKFLKQLFTGEIGNEEYYIQAENVTKTINETYGAVQVGLPFPKSYYDNIANELEQCMQGWGTKWSRMVELCENLSKKELVQVYVSFGGRVNKDFLNETMDLFGWFNDEFSYWSLDCTMHWDKLANAWQRSDLPNAPKPKGFLLSL